ncbi:MAG: protein kinase [Anaerolineales bacterium]|jgi:non-specific serine/threonine protein kinase
MTTQVIAGQYELGEELGSGGMGTVYKGLDTQTNQTVAIKQLKPELTDDEQIERFKREGEALRELNHPNIVKMLAAVEEDGSHYLIMEYVPGGDLRRLMKPEGLPYEKVLPIAIDICDALTRAHRLEIIHRDLKPANVLLAEDGTPRLTDFGLAHMAVKESLTVPEAIMGTMDYLSPEALSGEGVDTRADIWAFGVLLYEMLVGERPFQGDHMAALLTAILNQPVPDLEQLLPDCPIPLIDLLYRMLEKDPLARIPSVRYVGAELEDVLHGRRRDRPASRFETPRPEGWQRPKHNLPLQTTAFVGRERELTELARLLSIPDNRFLSIVAPGGMGKTRLALELASRTIEMDGQEAQAEWMTYPDGVYFVELAPLANPEAIVSAIAQATGYPLRSEGHDPKQQVLNFLANKEMLLVMDNYEHLLEGAPLVNEILGAAPEVVVLITSRQRLSQPGECLFYLSGMDFPDWDTLEDALEYASVKLFINSGRRARPGYELTPDHLDEVARICRLVEGMPLGIVLAASWLALLTPGEIADEIEQGLDILEAAGGEVEERHHSMRAVFDHSWELMSAAEQRVFMKLSIFRGGFTREAAQSITGAGLRTLMDLANKSLIRRSKATGRFEIHELLRQYAQEKLRVSGEGEAVRDAHGEYFATFVAERNQEAGYSQKEIGDQIDPDFDNVRIAWYWALERDHIDLLIKLVNPLNGFFYLRQYRFEPGIKLYEDALAVLDSESESIEVRQLYGRLLCCFAMMVHQHRGDLEEALILSEESIALAEETGDELGLADAKYTAAFCLRTMGKRLEEALELNEESSNLYKKLERLGGVGSTAWNKAWTLALMDAKCSQVGVLLRENLSITQQMDNKWWESVVTGQLGFLLLLQGDYPQAMALCQKSFSITQQEELWPTCLDIIAVLKAIHGDYKEAKTWYEKSIEINTAYGLSVERAYSMVGLAELASLEGRHLQALDLLKDCFPVFPKIEEDPQLDWVYGKLAYRRGDYDQASQRFETYLNKGTGVLKIIAWFWLGLSQIKLGQVNAAQQSLVRGLSGAFKAERRYYYPWGIFGFAQIHQAAGRNEQAAAFTALLHENPVTPYEFKVYAAELLEELEAELEPEVYEAAYQRGLSLDLDAVVQELLEEYAGGEKS